MYVIGLEGTAHTAGVGIVSSEGEVLANVKSVYTTEVGGFRPRDAAAHHAREFPGLIREALEVSGLSPGDLGLVAFSQGPGMGPCLRTTAVAARTIALALRIPIVGVNHCVAHLEIGRLRTEAEDPVMLYVSGGNTQVIAHAAGRYRVFGETLDIGIGNMLDKLAREMGLGFPGGPRIMEMARRGERLLDLPYSVKGMDVAFSGILTAAKAHLRRGARPEDVAFSVQEYAFAMVVEAAERAMAHLGKEEILLAGGVALNERLQEMARIMAEERGASYHCPEPEFLPDNGAMIAWTGYLMYSSGVRMRIEDTEVRQNFRTDEVEVTWR